MKNNQHKSANLDKTFRWFKAWRSDKDVVRYELRKVVNDTLLYTSQEFWGEFFVNNRKTVASMLRQSRNSLRI